MKTSQGKSKETKDRYSDSINKLTSIVNKLDMKIDRREAQYKPAFYQNRNRGCGQRQDNNHRYRNRSYSRDRNQSYNRGIGNFQYNRSYRPNYRARSRSRNGYEYGNGNRRNDRNDSMPNYRRDNYRQDSGNQRYRNRSPSQDTVGPGQNIEAILEITIGTSPTTEVKIEIEIDLVVEMKDKGPEHNCKTGIEKTGPLQGLDPVPM